MERTRFSDLISAILMEQISSRLMYQNLKISIDDETISSAPIQATLKDEFSIMGLESEKALEFGDRMRGGPLPYPVTLVEYKAPVS